MASFENMGSLRAFETLPPTQMEMPSFSASCMVMDGQTVKQLPQYMHCSSMTCTDGLPPTVAGRMAPVGQAATVLGISQVLGSRSWLILGGVRCTARTAMSEQWTAPHMFRQQAKATRSLAGRSERSKWGKSSSMSDFTTPEASEAAEWQCTQPWVWTMLVMAGPVPPTGYPSFSRRAMRGSTLPPSESRNSTLLRLVKRRYPPQNSSAMAAKSRSVSMLMRRGVAARTDHSFAPECATWTSTPALGFSW